MNNDKDVVNDSSFLYSHFGEEFQSFFTECSFQARWSDNIRVPSSYCLLIPLLTVLSVWERLSLNFLNRGWFCILTLIYKTTCIVFRKLCMIRTWTNQLTLCSAWCVWWEGWPLTTGVGVDDGWWCWWWWCWLWSILHTTFTF